MKEVRITEAKHLPKLTESEVTEVGVKAFVHSSNLHCTQPHLTGTRKKFSVGDALQPLSAPPVPQPPAHQHEMQFS